MSSSKEMTSDTSSLRDIVNRERERRKHQIEVQLF